MLTLVWSIYALFYYVPRLLTVRTILDMTSAFAIFLVMMISADTLDRRVTRPLLGLISAGMSIAYLLALSNNTVFDLSLFFSMCLWLMPGVFRLLDEESCNRLSPMV